MKRSQEIVCFAAAFLAIMSIALVATTGYASDGESNCQYKSPDCIDEPGLDCGGGQCTTGGTSACSCTYYTVAQACRCWLPIA